MIEPVGGWFTRSRSWAIGLSVGSSNNSYTKYLTRLLKNTYEALNDAKYSLSLKEEAVGELKDDYEELLTSKTELQRENNDLWVDTMDLCGQLSDLESKVVNIEETRVQLTAEINNLWMENKS